MPAPVQPSAYSQLFGGGDGLWRALQPTSQLPAVPAAPAAPAARTMPGPGFIPGDLQLNPAIAPQVPQGAARPFAMGEWVNNPGGGASNEISMTVMGDPTFNGGKATIIPSLWLKDGKPYVAKDEDEAVALAKASGLQFPSYETVDQAEAFANQREQTWQGIKPEDAGTVPPLWTVPAVK